MYVIRQKGTDLYIDDRSRWGSLQEAYIYRSLGLAQEDMADGGSKTEEIVKVALHIEGDKAPIINDLAIAMDQIKSARLALFLHCGSDDHWEGIGIADMRAKPWALGQYGNVASWVEGYTLTDPLNNPDYDKAESRTDPHTRIHIMRGSQYTMILAEECGEDRLWLLSNDKEFTGASKP